MQTALLLKLPYEVLTNSTLNEKFGIQNGVMPAIENYPAMRYFAVGNGGHRMSVGAGGIAKPEPVQHRGTDAALYNHLPFILRDVTNDLQIVDRAKYGLRRIETHNGNQYVAYYLKRIDMTDVLVATEFVTVADGVSTITDFVPDSSNLNPTPPVLNGAGVNIVTGDYVAATAKATLTLDTFDITELLNVANIIYNDESYAIVSEIALCAGVDKSISAPSVGNTTITFNEVIGTQVMSHVNTFFPLKFANAAVAVELDIGVSEPNLSIE